MAAAASKGVNKVNKIVKGCKDLEKNWETLIKDMGINCNYSFVILDWFR